MQGCWNRYEDLFKLCNWTYVKWSNTDKDDSNGETQDFCACVYAIWETIYNDGEQFLAHNKMLDTLLEHLDGRVYDYMEDTIYDFVLRHFKSEEELAKKEWERKWEELLTKFKGKLIAINSWLYIEGRYDLIMDNAEPDHDYVRSGTFCTPGTTIPIRIFWRRLRQNMETMTRQSHSTKE